MQRQRTREDARAYAISLAPKAEDLMQQLGADMVKSEGLLLAAFSKEDRARFIDLLGKLVESASDREARGATHTTSHEQAALCSGSNA